MTAIKTDVFKTDAKISVERESAPFFAEMGEEFDKILIGFYEKQPEQCIDKKCNICKENDFTSNCINTELFNGIFEFVKKNERIPYSVLTNKIFLQTDSEFEEMSQRLIVCINILDRLRKEYYSVLNEKNELLAEKKSKALENEIRDIKQSYERYFLLFKIFVKMMDHINLALKQKQVIQNNIGYIEQMQKTASEQMVIQTKFNNGLEANFVKVTEDSKNSLEDVKAGIYAQLISIVSIFVGISFVMFGGMTLLNNLFDYSGLSVIPMREMLTLGSLLGLILIDAMFCFIVSVFYLTGKHDLLKQNGLLSKTILYANLILVGIIIFNLINVELVYYMK